MEIDEENKQPESIQLVTVEAFQESINHIIRILEEERRYFDFCMLNIDDLREKIEEIEKKQKKNGNKK